MSSENEKDLPRVEEVRPMVPQKKVEKEKEEYVPVVEEIEVAGNKNVKHGVFDKTQPINIIEVGKPGVVKGQKTPSEDKQDT